MKQFVYDYSVIKRVVKNYNISIETRDLSTFEDDGVFYMFSDSKNDTVKRTVNKLKKLSCSKDTRLYFVNLLNEVSKYCTDEEYSDSVEFIRDNILYKVKFTIYNTYLDIKCKRANDRGENIADKRLVANSKGTNAYKFAELACKIDLSDISNYVEKYVRTDYIKSHIHFNDFGELVLDNNFKIDVDNDTSIEVEAKIGKDIEIYEEYEYTERRASDVVDEIVFNNFDFDYSTEALTYKNERFDLRSKFVSGATIRYLMRHNNIADVLKELEYQNVEITDEHIKFIKNACAIYKAVDDAVKNTR